mgnify:CR=1 FL=1
MKLNKEILDNIKIGDAVTLTSERPSAWNDEGSMDEFLGSTQTIRDISQTLLYFTNTMTDRWSFRINQIVSVNSISIYETADMFPIY